MVRQDNRLNLGSQGCSEPRFPHCTPAWLTRAKLRLKKKNKKKEVLFNDILGLRLLAIVLTTTQLQATALWGFPSLPFLERPTHSPSCLLSSALIRLIWCSAQKASTNLTYIGSSQVDASTQRWLGTCVRLWQLRRFHVLGRPG